MDLTKLGFKKIGITGDIHLESNSYNLDRTEEEDKVLNEMKETFKKEKVDAIVINGDFTDSPYPPGTKAMNRITGILQDFSEIATVIFNMGNHDWGGLTSLSKLKQIKNIIITNEPTKLSSNALILPYIKNKQLKKGVNIGGKEFFQDLWKKYKDVNLLIGHNGAVGSFYTPEGYDAEYLIKPEDIPKQLRLVLLSHIHNAKEGNITKDTKLKYISAPITRSFNEEKEKHGYMTMNLENLEYKYYETKNAKKFKSLKYEYADNVEEIKEKIEKEIKKGYYYRIIIKGDNLPKFIYSSIKNISDKIIKIKLEYNEMEEVEKDEIEEISLVSLFNQYEKNEKVRELFSKFNEQIK